MTKVKTFPFSQSTAILVKVTSSAAGHTTNHGEPRISEANWLRSWTDEHGWEGKWRKSNGSPQARQTAAQYSPSCCPARGENQSWAFIKINTITANHLAHTAKQYMFTSIPTLQNIWLRLACPNKSWLPYRLYSHICVSTWHATIRECLCIQ